MPRIIKLDAMQIKDLKKKDPGAYGSQLQSAVESALQFSRDKDHNFFNKDAFDSAMGWYPSECARIRADEVWLVNVCRADAGEAAYAARQFEYVKQITRDIKYGVTSIRNWVTISSEAGPAADSISWGQGNSTGDFALSSDKTKDAPRIDVSTKLETVLVKDLEAAYGITIMDIRKAMMAGVPLQQRLFNAARLKYEQSLNKWGWQANGTAKWAGVRGLLYMLGAMNTATLNIALNGNWCNSDGTATATTGLQILQDINTLINYPETSSLLNHPVTDLVFPAVQYGYINTTIVADTFGKTILQVAKEQHPDVKFGRANELSNVVKPSAPNGAAKTNCAIAYSNTENNLSLEVPQPYEEYPILFTGKEYVTTCHYRIGGGILYYPGSFLVAEGL